jgi:DNA-binding transcriptional ArsR family regulator
MIPVKVAHQIATKLQAMADPTRLRIFLALAGRSMNVQQIARALDMKMNAISPQLRSMATLGLVYCERQGPYRIYSAPWKRTRIRKECEIVHVPLEHCLFEVQLDLFKSSNPTEDNPNCDSHNVRSHHDRASKGRHPSRRSGALRHKPRQ